MCNIYTVSSWFQTILKIEFLAGTFADILEHGLLYSLMGLYEIIIKYKLIRINQVLYWRFQKRFNPHYRINPQGWSIWGGEVPNRMVYSRGAREPSSHQIFRLIQSFSCNSGCFCTNLTARYFRISCQMKEFILSHTTCRKHFLVTGRNILAL